MKNPIDAKLKISDCIGLTAKGFCMGIAHIIPGVSGGTIAFIFGIYSDFIDAIKSFDLNFMKHVVTLKWRDAVNYVAWKFLASLGVGMLAAIFSLSKIFSWLLTNKPVLIHSFFFGLILATVPIIGKHVKKWTPLMILLLMAVVLGTYNLVGMVPLQTPNSLWFLFLCGALAVCAMILPGISGAFIFVLLGKYHFIVEAVNNRDFFILIVVAVGGIVGLLTLVRVLSWFFHKYNNLTMTVLTGLVIGSLRKIWPWKEIAESITGSHGKVIPIKVINILPASFSPEVVWAVLLMVLGFIAALLLDYSPKKK